MADNCTSSNSSFSCLINGEAGSALGSAGISTKTFALNLATGLALFLFQLTGFFLLKSSDIGRRIYQPKTYLVADRLRVEPVPANPFRWLYKIFKIDGADLRAKCGLDGYFFIRLIRGMIIIFAPLMAIIVTILLPINYNGGKNDRDFHIAGKPMPQNFSVTGLDTLSWQNVAPTQTNRYWAHLICALIAISWTLYRIYREKLHFIEVRQSFLLSPEHRLKASARTILITSIPYEYQSEEALKAFFDVFVDNDDRSRLQVWINRDYRSLRALVNRRINLRATLEKEELRVLRLVNKRRTKGEDVETVDKQSPPSSSADQPISSIEMQESRRHADRHIASAFEADCQDPDAVWQRDLRGAKEPQVTIAEDKLGNWNSVSMFQFRRGRQQRSVPKAAWLRFEVARCTVEIERITRTLDNDHLFPRQNSAFIQFDRQMSANMACSLVSHHQPGKMTPRFLDVAPHEILWPNMGLTSTQRFVRTCIAIFLFLGMLVLWGIPAAFLGSLSQLDLIRDQTTWLHWLRPWPQWIISLISGPLTAILLALLVQLVVPALCRKLAVLCGAPTRSKREIVTQAFYFTFLFIELVLITSLSSGITATITTIVHNPTTIPQTLATDLPKAANYFFNYLIIQGLGFSGSVLFQYLRILFITTIWPWFTHTPRREAWLQTIIPHQMWGNVYPLFTNFAAIGLIYSIIAPLVLIFISATFSIFWIAYRHNYYYVQRVKVDTHGRLFSTALSQLFVGVYVMEIALIGLFFLVRDTGNNVACKAQAIIMIVALILTAAYHYLLEGYLRPLYELLPVSLEDSAADAERIRFSNEITPAGVDHDDIRFSVEAPSTNYSEHAGDGIEVNDFSDKQVEGHSSGINAENATEKAADTRRTLRGLRKRVSTQLTTNEAEAAGRTNISRRQELANHLAASISAYPDELTDLSVQERAVELQIAYQDPVTRDPPPIIWIPQDVSGVSEEMIKRGEKYGRYVQYSNAGAYLNKRNKCEITRPEPDVRTDWLLDWVL